MEYEEFEKQVKKWSQRLLDEVNVGMEDKYSLSDVEFYLVMSKSLNSHFMDFLEGEYTLSELAAMFKEEYWR